MKVVESQVVFPLVLLYGLLYDGFGLDREVCVYPQYSNDGGVESERTYVKQLVQKYVNDGSDDNLFNEEEIENAWRYVLIDTSL